jgi:hypothetical protein
MIRRIIGPLPTWATREHPVLNYHLRGQARRTRPQRYLLGLLVLVMLAFLLAGGYAYATNLFANPPGQNLTESANRIFFFPLVILQLLVGVTSLSMTVGAVGEEQRRVTWDNLRATPSGAALTIRTRWAAVFHQSRFLLLVITALRLLLIFGLLRDLTAFQGDYLNLLIGGVTPTIPPTLGGVPFAVPVGAVLLSLFMTAAALLPFTTLALDAAVGLWLATRFHRRVYTLVIQFLLVLFRVVLVGGLVYVTLAFVDNNINLSVRLLDWLPLEWITLFAFSGFADQGVKLLHLGFAGEVWVLTPYSVFIGPALLILAIGQAALADWILGRAIRTAERHG